MQSLLHKLPLPAVLHPDSNWGQFALSLLICMSAYGAHRLAKTLISRRYSKKPDPALAALNISIRNSLALTVFGLLVILWSGEIRHIFVSLAAIAAALLVVSRDYLVILFGSLMRLFSSPFALGDVVEVAGYRGKVVDIDSLTFKLLMQNEMGQLVSQTVELPNSLLLSSPVINHNNLGDDFCFHVTKICLPINSDLAGSLALLEKCASQVCAELEAQARAWLNSVSKQFHIDFPSSTVKVLLVSKDYKQVDLHLRFVAPQRDRLNMEQRILKLFFSRMPLQPMTA